MADDDDGKNYERFDVDNDYEGGQWVGDEYFFSRKRAKRQQTRDEQLYGYQSDDSDGETRRAKRRERVQADYTKPVGFVSSGVVTSSDDKPQDVERAEHRAEQVRSCSQSPVRECTLRGMRSKSQLWIPWRLCHYQRLGIYLSTSQ